MTDKPKFKSHIWTLLPYAQAQPFVYHTAQPVAEVAATLKAIKSGGMFSNVSHTKILKGIADGIHAMRNPYKLLAESPHPKQSPKHSRPSSHREKVERGKPFIQKVDLRDTLEADEKIKQKRS